MIRRGLRWIALAFTLALALATSVQALSPASRTALLAQTASPAQLFAHSEPGFWLDPSDLSTLYQDAAGTTPVTAVGQPVGKILDKSGRGNHATQSTAGNRPTLQQDSSGRYYLSFNGTSSSLATAAIDFTGTNKVTIWAGVRKASDATAAALVELTTGASNTGMFAIYAPSANAATDYAVASKGTLLVLPTATGFAAPNVAALTGIVDIGAPAATLRRNGTQVATLTTNQGTGAYSNAAAYIGARAGTSLFFNGSLYSLIVRGAASSATQLQQGETWTNRKTGAY